MQSHVIWNRVEGINDFHFARFWTLIDSRQARKGIKIGGRILPKKFANRQNMLGRQGQTPHFLFPFCFELELRLN